MSQSGVIVFYSVDSGLDVKAVFPQILEWTGARNASSVTRLPNEQQGWKDFQAILDDDETSSDEPELIRVGVGIDDIVRLCEPGKFLHCDLASSPQGARMYEAIKEGIPPDVRGKFLPADVIVNVCGHDLFEDSENDYGKLIDRAFLSVNFFGYSTPKDWKAFRESVFELPEVRAIKSELGRILGDVRQAVYWSA